MGGREESGMTGRRGIWGLAQLLTLLWYRGHEDEVLDIAFDSVGQHLVSVSADGEYTPTQYTPTHTCTPAHTYTHLHSTHTTHLHSTHTHTPAQYTPTHTYTVHTYTHLLVHGCISLGRARRTWTIDPNTGTGRLYDVATQNCIAELKGHTGEISKVGEGH